MRIFFLLIMISFTLVTGCKKDKLEGDKAVFIGKWNWSYTRYIYDLCSGDPSITDILSPDLENKEYSLYFDKKGIVEFYEDGVLKEKHRVVFSSFNDECIYGADYSRFEIYLDNQLNDNDYLFQGCVKEDSIIVKLGYPYPSIDYPLIEVNCEKYISYFVKE